MSFNSLLRLVSCVSAALVQISTNCSACVFLKRTEADWRVPHLPLQLKLSPTVVQPIKGSKDTRGRLENCNLIYFCVSLPLPTPYLKKNNKETEGKLFRLL